MPALMAVISGDADPLRREMKAVERMAADSGVRIGQNIGGERGSMFAMRPMMHLKEAIKNLFKGDMGGAATSIAILAHHFGLLTKLTTSSASAAVKLAEADRAEAVAASTAAIASTKKYQAALAALYSENGETAANLEEATAAETKATADILAAKASSVKADASELAAAAASAEATTSLSVAGVIVGAVAIIIGAYFLWKKRVDDLTKAMSGVKLPETVKSDIGRLSAYETGWRKIADAVKDATDEINSANTAMEISRGILTENQRAEKEELNLKKEMELERAGGSQQKRLEVLEKYAKLEHDQEKKQLDENLRAQMEHTRNLEQEEIKKHEQANAIHVETEEDAKAHLQNLINYNDAFNKKDEKTGKSEAEMAQEREERYVEIKKQANAPAGSISAPRIISEQEEAQHTTDQQTLEQARKAARDLTLYQQGEKDRDSQRQDQTRLNNEAAKAASDKIKAQKELQRISTLGQTTLNNNDKIRQMDIDKEMAKKPALIQAHNTDLQRLGAFGQSAVLVDLNRTMVRHLSSIDSKTGAKGAGNGIGSGGSFGGVVY
jgi:hypothetical protein